MILSQILWEMMAHPSTIEEGGSHHRRKRGAIAFVLGECYISICFIKNEGQTPSLAGKSHSRLVVVIANTAEMRPAFCVVFG